MVVVLVGDDDGYNLAKEVGGEFLSEFDRVDEDSLVGFF